MQLHGHFMSVFELPPFRFRTGWPFIARFMALVTGVLLLAGLGFGPSLQAAERGSIKVAQQVAVDMTRDLIELIADVPAEVEDAATDEALLAKVDERMSSAVDFTYIARRVMGRPGRRATPAQLEEFVGRFRESLVKTYVRTMAGFQISALQVREARVNPDRADRGTVHIEVSSPDGNSYPVEYSMQLLDDEGWMVRNVKVNQLNIGLNLANQFQRALQQAPLSQVIAQWPDVGGGIGAETEGE